MARRIVPLRWLPEWGFPHPIFCSGCGKQLSLGEPVELAPERKIFCKRCHSEDVLIYQPKIRVRRNGTSLNRKLFRRYS